jgi:hypothetical protein
LKHEIFRKPFLVSFDGLMQTANRDSIQVSQLLAQHDLLASHQKYLLLDSLDWNDGNRFLHIVLMVTRLTSFLMAPPA